MISSPKKRKFGDYIIEFIIVLLGITIAFWLSNLGEKLKEKKLEKVYLQQLNEDITKDINSFKRTIEIGARKMAKLDKGITYVANNQNSLSADSIAAYGFLIGNYDFFYPSNHTYLTLQQSGDLAFIRNQELKKKLVALYQSYALIKNEQNNLIQALDDNFFPELYQNVDMITGRITDSDYFTQPRCTNFIAFTKQQTSQIINNDRTSRRLAQETVDLIEIELGILQTIQSDSN